MEKLHHSAERKPYIAYQFLTSGSLISLNNAGHNKSRHLTSARNTGGFSLSSKSAAASNAGASLSHCAHLQSFQKISFSQDACMHSNNTSKAGKTQE
jgi:hypothetical protein